MLTILGQTKKVHSKMLLFSLFFQPRCKYPARRVQVWTSFPIRKLQKFSEWLNSIQNIYNIFLSFSSSSSFLPSLLLCHHILSPPPHICGCATLQYIIFTMKAPKFSFLSYYIVFKDCCSSSIPAGKKITGPKRSQPSHFVLLAFL